VRGLPGICQYSGNIMRRIIFVNVLKSSDQEHPNDICAANINDQVAYFKHGSIHE
jgi:hypothetical protein